MMNHIFLEVKIYLKEKKEIANTTGSLSRFPKLFFLLLRVFKKETWSNRYVV